MNEASVDSVEPLEPPLWFARFRILEKRALALGYASPEPLLRHLFHLSVLTPVPLRHLIQTDVSEQAFEAFLACGAYDSAALSLVGRSMECKTTRRRTTKDLKVEVSPGPELPRTIGVADCLATAFVIAFCKCMNALSDLAELDAPVRNRRPPAIQSVRHRKPSTH